MDDDDYLYMSSGSDDYCYYDDDDDNDEDHIPEEEGELCCGRGPSCKVITRESLMAAQKEEVQTIMDMLSLKEHHARTLLIHYRWDAYKIVGLLADKGKEKLFSVAGVSVDDCHNQDSSNSLDEVTCGICFEEIAVSEMTTMDCGHCFCNNCWLEHFTVKINEGQSKRITCMAYKCSAICDERSIRNLVGTRDQDLAEKFDRFLLESYIDDNKRVKWCPSVPHCGNAIRIEDDEYCEVECACGVQFCFNCSYEAHSPCSCPMWDLWMKKSKNEGESVNWMSENTKSCPRCHKPVEKDGGCNLVSCICGQCFCWLCGGATGADHTWTSIAGHSCGRYEVDYEKQAEEEQRNYWRFYHYYCRFRAHIDSLNAEANLKEKLQRKVTTLEERELETRDFSWVLNGMYRLFRSRRILSYSYPFAYYMFGNELFQNEMTKEEKEIKQRLFEDQQQQLEANIERLSMLLEEPFAKYPIEQLSQSRMSIITQSAVVDKLCRQLYDCIDNDLLGHLQQATHIIAPYRSMGVEKASELSNGSV